MQAAQRQCAADFEALKLSFHSEIKARRFFKSDAPSPIPPQLLLSQCEGGCKMPAHRYLLPAPPAPSSFPASRPQARMGTRGQMAGFIELERLPAASPLWAMSVIGELRAEGMPLHKAALGKRETMVAVPMFGLALSVQAMVEGAWAAGRQQGAAAAAAQVKQTQRGGAAGDLVRLRR